MYSVLICEDEYFIRKGLIYLVDWEKCGCVVIGEAENGEEGIKQIQELNPDIVITDINMPICSGLDMIKNTVQEYEYSAIILSGYNEFEFAQKAIKYGVSEYLLKPVEKEEIETAILRAIDQKKMHDVYQKQLEEQEDMKHLQIAELEIDNYDELVQQMISYIQEHYAQKITISKLCDEFNYSETILNRKFKEVCKTTINDYINRVRIQKSIELMKENSLYIYDIATHCGFKDYKYFALVFKKYIGYSPKEFSKKIKSV